MPDKTVPTYEYADEHVQLSVDTTPADGMITIRAASGGCNAAIELTVLGAQRLSTMLGAAITRTITRG